MSWFKPKKKTAEEESLELLNKRVFPGGETEKLTRSMELSKICGLKLDFKEAQFVYISTKLLFEIQKIKFDGVSHCGTTAELFIQEVIKFSKNKLSYFEAIPVVSYVLFGRVDPTITTFEALKIYFIGLFGSNEQGYDCDVIPFAMGEFGVEPTNPVPVRGVAGSNSYLQRLRSSNGETVNCKRIRAIKTGDANLMVDEYEVFDTKNILFSKIYVCPYHQRISNKAPKGFSLIANSSVS